MGAAQDQFRQQRETAVKTIRQMAAERDESRTQVGEVEERLRKLEEELTATQEGLRAGTESANGQQKAYWRTVAPTTLMLVSTDLLAMSVQSDPTLLKIVRNMQLQCQNFLELLRRNESE